MSLEPGLRLGVYEIIAPLGAGGMGEVYRARDTRIGRDVAVKILPDAMSGNDDRVKRFRREAQAAGGLNHPNLLTIYDLGSDRERLFIVSELLEGTTLRERMSGGPMGPRRAIEYASQIAEGLAAAHEQGVVHRDLKPENIFVTRDGRVKILDFGLAKVTSAIPAGLTNAQTAQQVIGTDPGTILGTAGYMSPEQVRGNNVDARSDIFALGAILYEMLSGRRAFHGTSSVDTLHAILHADPPELSSTTAHVPPALERIVNHCLEKDPERRFQSARDLAFDLGSVSGSSAELIAPKQRTKLPAAGMWILALAVVAVASWFAARGTAHRAVPRFQRLTFESHAIFGAAFTTDQQSVVFAMARSGGSTDVFVATVGSPEMRSIGLAGANVLGVSSKGELAVLLDAHFTGGFLYSGTLARLPIAGGAPREIAADVQWADWTPAGDDLLILRSVAGKSRVELPFANVIFESNGWIGTPKISPDGKWIALIEHQSLGDDGGRVLLIDRERKKQQIITPNYTSIEGLAWRPDGREIWYTAAEQGNLNVLYSASASKKPRLLVAAPGVLQIQAIARDGRALLTESNLHVKVFAHRPDVGPDRDLSWLDWSLMRDITRDGKRLLFDETAEGGGKSFSVYVRDADGSPAVRLGEGVGMGFSPDGNSVVAIHPQPIPAQIYIYPTGVGQGRQMTHDALNHNSAAFTPDGRSIVFRAAEGTRPSRLYVQGVEGGSVRAISPEGVSGNVIVSPDGRWVFNRGPDGNPTLYAVAGGSEAKLTELPSNFVIGGWSGDSKEIFVVRREENPAHILRFDIAKRTFRPWRDVPIPESLAGIAAIRVTPDGQSYGYSIATRVDDLFLVDHVD